MRVRRSLLFAALLLRPVVIPAQVNVLTAHNDNGRTGANTNETILTPVTVNSNGFGKIFSLRVDGSIFTQPLYVSNLPIPGKGTHNVVFVGTMHDSVYAFDADSVSASNSVPLWRTSFINPAAGITAPIAANDAVDSPSQDCRTFFDEIGVVGTPVIDLPSQTMYVVARTKETLPPPNSGTYTQYHRLHALDITTGLDRPNSPVIIDGIVPGTGVESIGGSFDSTKRNQSSALPSSSRMMSCTSRSVLIATATLITVGSWVTMRKRCNRPVCSIRRPTRSVAVSG